MMSTSSSLEDESPLTAAMDDQRLSIDNRTLYQTPYPLAASTVVREAGVRMTQVQGSFLEDNSASLTNPGFNEDPSFIKMASFGDAEQSGHDPGILKWKGNKITSMENQLLAGDDSLMNRSSLGILPIDKMDDLSSSVLHYDSGHHSTKTRTVQLPLFPDAGYGPTNDSTQEMDTSITPRAEDFHLGNESDFLTKDPRQALYQSNTTNSENFGGSHMNIGVKTNTRHSPSSSREYIPGSNIQRHSPSSSREYIPGSNIQRHSPSSLRPGSNTQSKFINKETHLSQQARREVFPENSAPSFDMLAQLQTNQPPVFSMQQHQQHHHQQQQQRVNSASVSTQEHALSDETGFDVCGGKDVMPAVGTAAMLFGGSEPDPDASVHEVQIDADELEQFDDEFSDTGEFDNTVTEDVAPAYFGGEQGGGRDSASSSQDFFRAATRGPIMQPSNLFENPHPFMLEEDGLYLHNSQHGQDEQPGIDDVDPKGNQTDHQDSMTDPDPDGCDRPSPTQIVSFSLLQGQEEFENFKKSGFSNLLGEGETTTKEDKLNNYNLNDSNCNETDSEKLGHRSSFLKLDNPDMDENDELGFGHHRISLDLELRAKDHDEYCDDNDDFYRDPGFEREANQGEGQEEEELYKSPAAPVDRSLQAGGGGGGGGNQEGELDSIYFRHSPSFNMERADGEESGVEADTSMPYSNRGSIMFDNESSTNYEGYASNDPVTASQQQVTESNSNREFADSKNSSEIDTEDEVEAVRQEMRATYMRMGDDSQNRPDLEGSYGEISPDDREDRRQSAEGIVEPPLAPGDGDGQDSIDMRAQAMQQMQQLQQQQELQQRMQQFPQADMRAQEMQQMQQLQHQQELQQRMQQFPQAAYSSTDSIPGSGGKMTTMQFLQGLGILGGGDNESKQPLSPSDRPEKLQSRLNPMGNEGRISDNDPNVTSSQERKVRFASLEAGFRDRTLSGASVDNDETPKAAAKEESRRILSNESDTYGKEARDESHLYSRLFAPTSGIGDDTTCNMSQTGWPGLRDSTFNLGDLVPSAPSSAKQEQDNCIYEEHSDIENQHHLQQQQQQGLRQKVMGSEYGFDESEKPEVDQVFKDHTLEENSISAHKTFLDEKNSPVYINEHGEAVTDLAYRVPLDQVSDNPFDDGCCAAGISAIFETASGERESGFGGSAGFEEDNNSAEFISGDKGLAMLEKDEQDFKKENIFTQDEVMTDPNESQLQQLGGTLNSLGLPDSWSFHTHYDNANRPSWLSENSNDAGITPLPHQRISIGAFMLSRTEALGSLDGGHGGERVGIFILDLNYSHSL